MAALGTPRTLEWRTTGAGLNSLEDVSAGAGYLGVDYTVNGDTRWEDGARLGPLVTTISCSAAGGTAADTNGFALSGAMNATLFLYGIRGTKWAKVKVSDLSLVSDGTETELGEAATSILYTKAANGTGEISIGMGATAFRVIGTVGNTTTDTHSANNESLINRILKQASPANTIVGLGSASSIENIVRHNVLTGTVTMDASAFVTRSTVSGEAITWTGFAIDGNFWLLGTTNGPYFLDNDFQEFRPLIPEIAQSTYNCAAMDSWSYFGVIYSLAKAVRYSRNLQGESIGPERFILNTSPITNPMTAFVGTERWGYGAFYNIPTGDTYICAMRPRQAGEPGNSLVSYFPLVKLASAKCKAISEIDTASVRTNPTLVFGNGSDISWITEGRIDHEIADTNYRFASAGTVYLTEARRDSHYFKHIDYVELKVSGCASGKTVTVSLSCDGATAVQVGATINTNGVIRIPVPFDENFGGTYLKPSLALATDASSASPVVEWLRIGCRYRQKDVDGNFIEEGVA